MSALLGKVAAALLLHGGLQLLGAAVLREERSGAVRTLAGLGVFGTLAVLGLGSGAPLGLLVTAAALGAAAGALRLARRRPSAAVSRSFPPAAEALLALAVGTAAAAALLVGVRTVGGDEVYHLGRIRAVLEAPRLTLADPFSIAPGAAGRYYLVPLFHLLAAVPAKALGLSPMEAYDAVSLWAVLLVAGVVRHLGRSFAGAAGGAFAAVLGLQALWLPAVDVGRNQFNYLFPFTPGQVASWLLVLLLALALTAASERDFGWTRWRPVVLGFGAAALLHPSPLVLFFPWLGLALALLLVTTRYRLGDTGILLTRLAPLLLVAAAYLLAVRSLAVGKVLENDFDPAATRRAPLHAFEAATVERLWFLNDHRFLVRPTGQMLLGGALAVALAGLHLRRGGSAAFAFVGATPLFALLAIHNPVVFPFVARALSYHFGLLYGLEASLVPGLSLPLLAALVAGDGAGGGSARPGRLGTVGLTLLLVLFSGYRILVARRVGQELHETVSRPALWSAVERAGDRNGTLLCPADTAYAVPAFTSMTPYFCNAAPCRPFHADYFGRRRRAEELLAAPLDAAVAAREGIWGTLRRNDGTGGPVPPDGGTLVYQDRDYTLVRFPPAGKGAEAR